ncbi:MAG: glycosyltransferase N-terminal domain-containing protein [Pseudomonadota bacterium]
MLLYRTLLTLLAPGIAVLLAWRVLRGRDTLADLRERLAHGQRTGARPTNNGPLHRPCLWLHAASNGELTAARPMLDALRAAHPTMRCVLTTNTTSGRDLGRSWSLPGTTVVLAPLDTRRVVRRFLQAHRPTALLIVENELWPNRMHLMQQLRHPVVLVGARMSTRSAQRWRRAARVLRPLLSHVALAVPQDAASAQAIAALGVPAERLTAPVSLKSAVVMAVPDPKRVHALGFDRDQTLIAASTHAGEEETILAAIAQARKARPALRLILAPRHPPRGPEVARLVRASGLSLAVRSEGAAPGDAAVFLADTLGEMPLWYAAAGICFIGGSLVEKGGHTPYEPAQFSCALLTGPHVENAAAAFAALRSAGAVRIVDDADALAAVLTETSLQAQQAAGARARETLARADLGALAARLSPALGLPPTAPDPAAANRTTP